MTAWLWAAVARAECGDTDALLDTLEQAALEGRFDDAAAASDAVVASFGCGPWAEREAVARLWLAEALVSWGRGDEAASDRALTAAAHLAPEQWNDLYGPALRARWDAARAGAPPPGRVDLRELPPGYAGAVDGEVREFPVALPSGLHLLQIGAGTAASARRFDLSPGLDLVLDAPAGLPDLAPPPAAVSAPAPAPPPGAVPASPHRRGRRVAAAVAVGAVAGLAYGATFGTSERYRDDPSTALRAVNNGLIVGSAGLGSTAVALFVRGLATRGAPR